MNSMANIIGMEASPSGIAISSAIKADLVGLVDQHAKTDNDGDWPGSRKAVAKERLYTFIARDLLADVLDKRAMAMIDAVLKCEDIKLRSMFDADQYSDDATAFLLTEANDYADDVTEIVATHNANMNGAGLDD